jgi:hypothetical protein
MRTRFLATALAVVTAFGFTAAIPSLSSAQVAPTPPALTVLGSGSYGLGYALEGSFSLLWQDPSLSNLARTKYFDVEAKPTGYGEAQTIRINFESACPVVNDFVPRAVCRTNDFKVGTYIFQVRALDADGKVLESGPWSGSIPIWRVPHVTNLTTAIAGTGASQRLLVSWDKPLSSYGPIQSYKVKVENAFGTVKTTIVSGAQTSTEINQYGGTYSVKVLPISAIGQVAPGSERFVFLLPIQVTVPPKPELEPVQKLRWIQNGATVNVWWAPPIDNGAVRPVSYKVTGPGGVTVTVDPTNLLPVSFPIPTTPGSYTYGVTAFDGYNSSYAVTTPLVIAAPTPTTLAR